MPSRKCQAGETVFVRALVLEACSDTFRVRIEDNSSSMVVTTWVPAGEIARHEDIGELKLIRRIGRFLDR